MISNSYVLPKTYLLFVASFKKSRMERLIDTLFFCFQMMLIINETLRLYPPAVTITRDVVKDVKLGSINIPAGAQVFLPMTAVHHDREIWGEDSHIFNPWRFNMQPKHLGAFFPFGLGPRFCVGQNLATVEGKVALAMIIKKYSFEVSPAYRHAPLQYLTLQPQHGVQIIFRKIED